MLTERTESPRLKRGEDVEKQYADAIGLAEDVARGSVSALEVLIRHHYGITKFNSERKALQLTGCDGTSIVASIPLTTRQAKVFSSE